MKSFMEHCCEECWHSPSKPCDLFVQCCTEGPLCHNNDQCAEKFRSYNRRLKYLEHELPVIFIGMGTCGLAAGARKVEEAIRAELTKLNIQAKIEATGCIGYCAKEVIVDIKFPDEERISYCEITPKLVPKLMQKVFVEKGIFKEKLLGSHQKNTKGIPCINDDPFFKHQLKIVLENCGIINPDSLDTYISFGGFKGVDKVLRHLTPEQVIKEILQSGLRGRGGAGFPTGKNGSLPLNREPIRSTLSVMPMKVIRVLLWTVRYLKAILSG